MASNWYQGRRAHGFIEEIIAAHHYLNDPTISKEERKQTYKALEYWLKRFEDHMDEHFPSQVSYK